MQKIFEKLKEVVIVFLHKKCQAIQRKELGFFVLMFLFLI